MISYIITHRGSTGTRIQNLDLVLEHISDIPEISEVIIVEQDAKPNMTSKDGYKHVYAYNPGLFNRSWGLNIGYKNSLNDLLLFSDNDIIIPRDNIIKSLNSDKRVIKPYTNFIDLDKRERNRYIANKETVYNVPKRYRKGCNLCGGSIMFKKDAFEFIKGWDERFRGWGAEDDHMFYKVRSFIGMKSIEVVNGDAYHLWHDRTVNDTNKQPNWKYNYNLFNRDRRMPKGQFLDYIRPLGEIGLVDKYC